MKARRIALVVFAVLSLVGLLGCTRRPSGVSVQSPAKRASRSQADGVVALATRLAAGERVRASGYYAALQQRRDGRWLTVFEGLVRPDGTFYRDSTGPLAGHMSAHGGKPGPRLQPESRTMRAAREAAIGRALKPFVASDGAGEVRGLVFYYVFATYSHEGTTGEIWVESDGNRRYVGLGDERWTAANP